MGTAIDRTCTWCGVSKRTAQRSGPFVCTACDSIDRRASSRIVAADALTGGQWVNRRGVQIWVPEKRLPVVSASFARRLPVVFTSSSRRLPVVFTSSPDDELGAA